MTMSDRVLEKGDLRKKVLGGLFWKMGERLLAQGVSFVVSVILARLLLPDDYGLIAIVLVFISIADVFISSGFATALIQKKDAIDEDFSTIFYCSLVCSVVLYVLIYWSAPFIAEFYREESLVLLLRVYALILPLGVYSTIQHAYVSRNMVFKKFFFSTLFGTILSGVLGILLAYWGFGVWALVVQSFTNTLVDTIFLMFTISWHPQLKFSWKTAKKMMNYGSKILFADLSGTFFGQLRSLIIGRVYTSADLAFYNKGQQIPTLITGNIGSSIIAVLFPALSNESNDLKRVKQLTRRSLKVLTFLMFPALFGIAAVAKPLITVLLTSKWIGCVPYLQLLCIEAAIGLLTTLSLQTIKAIGKGNVVVKLELWKKPVYVILLLIGVKKGVLAIAVTMVIYGVYATVVNMRQLEKHVGYSMSEQFKDLLPSLLITCVMFVVVWWINIPFGNNVIELLMKIILGILIYLLGAKAIKLDAFIYVSDIIHNMLNKRKK